MSRKRVPSCAPGPPDPGCFVGGMPTKRGGEYTMPTPQKAKSIDELSDQLTRANLVIVTDYRGLKVTDLQTLRGNLRPSGAEIHIAKNTLTRIAAGNAGVVGLDPLLEGPSALVFSFEDAVQTAKAVSDFVRTSRILSVKGGVM